MNWFDWQPVLTSGYKRALAEVLGRMSDTEYRQRVRGGTVTCWSHVAAQEPDAEPRQTERVTGSPGLNCTIPLEWWVGLISGDGMCVCVSAHDSENEKFSLAQLVHLFVC